MKGKYGTQDRVRRSAALCLFRGCSRLRSNRSLSQPCGIMTSMNGQKGKGFSRTQSVSAYFTSVNRTRSRRVLMVLAYSCCCADVAHWLAYKLQQLRRRLDLAPFRVRRALAALSFKLLYDSNR